MGHIRKPAVAGMFYPDDPRALADSITQYLRGAPERSAGDPPKAIIAPHAGYVYSGPTAGRAYAAYGGIYIAASLAWLWAVEKQMPDRWDLMGAAVCIAGAAIILLAPHHRP